MTDKYAAWNKYAPQMIADLMHDFGFTDWQAAAFPGNAAAESGYWTTAQEKDPIAGRGGLGPFQWTGSRRRAYEAWLKRKGYGSMSYEGAYSYLFRELVGPEARVVPLVKKATTLEDTTRVVCAQFERPAVNNYDKRITAAQEALALYRKNPPAPTVWAPDIKEPNVPTDPVTPADPPTVPIWKSPVFMGLAISLVLKTIWGVFKWTPLSDADEAELVRQISIGVSYLADTVALGGRLASKVQPLTLTDQNKDKA